MDDFKVGDFIIAYEWSNYRVTNSDIICKVLGHRIGNPAEKENLLVVAWCMKEENPYLFTTQSKKLLDFLKGRTKGNVEEYYVNPRNFHYFGKQPQVFVVTITGTIVNIVNSNTGAEFCSTGEDFKSTIRKTIFGLIEVSTEGAKL